MRWTGAEGTVSSRGAHGSPWIAADDPSARRRIMKPSGQLLDRYTTRLARALSGFLSAGCRYAGGARMPHIVGTLASYIGTTREIVTRNMLTPAMILVYSRAMDRSGKHRCGAGSAVRDIADSTATRGCSENTSITTEASEVTAKKRMSIRSSAYRQALRAKLRRLQKGESPDDTNVHGAIRHVGMWSPDVAIAPHTLRRVREDPNPPNEPAGIRKTGAVLIPSQTCSSLPLRMR